jgi:uncharacterized protein (TIGR02600 family)
MHCKKGFAGKRVRAKSGMALILVLSLLVLLSALIIGYFATIMTERTSSRHYAVTTVTRQLADSALNIIMAQIHDATVRSGTAWSSQPGLIRTFDTRGNPSRAYKLYSSDEMTVDGKFDVRAAHDSEVPSDWAQRSAEYIDLNAFAWSRGRKCYPILDANAAGAVEGFAADSRDGVAMPVRWIYVLKDGQLVKAAASGGGKTVTVSAATKDNPVVGRIAFWTDDETCKININTASEGVFWDVPRTQSTEDRKFAASQPVYAEYQRFPGHPATVCLSTVFPDWVGGTAPQYAKIYALSPRVATGGSQEGTAELTTTIPLVAAKTDRLYASLDELLYTTQFSTERQQNTSLSVDQIDRLRFFLTVSNRSPELNLFNMPRISLWPIHTDSSRRSAVDSLMAFASTVTANSARLYFTRQTPLDATTDYAGDSNNATLYAYLQRLTARSVPGFAGGSLADKYGSAAERDQILTEMIDAVRCTNLMESATADFLPYTASTSATKPEPGQGQVVPLEIGSSRGLGRFATISEAALDFYAISKSGNTTKMGVALLFSTFTPGQGFTAYDRNYSHQVTTTATFSACGAQTFVFSGTNTVSSTQSSGIVPSNDSPLGGDEGFGHTFKSSYPFVVKTLTVSGSTFSFEGGAVKVDIYTGTTLVQTVNVQFRAVTELPVPQIPVGSYANFTTYSNRVSLTTDLNFFQYDTVRSVEVAGGDARLVAALKTVAADRFVPGDATAYASNTQFSFGLLDGTGHYYSGAKAGSLVAGAAYSTNCQPKVPASVASALTAGAGDWDNGVASLPDGAYIGKPDEGCVRSSGTTLPYFNPTLYAISPKAFFAAREVASPVVFGSLPSGVVRGKPWQTLAFCPNPAAGGSHPGLANPPDYLWFDLWTMPVVEPYALSEPLSALGRVNLNYELAPFTGITRTTALRAALKATRVMAIPTVDAAIYKNGSTVPSGYRYDISADETLKLIDKRFVAGDAYRCAAEICSIPLVPKNAPGSPTAETIATWWQDYALTGDNSREMPYNHLYPLLTTQSNTFTVHFRAQSLTKKPGSDPALWDESGDFVSGEYRGSATLERRIDPGDSRLKTVDVLSTSLTPYYRFRVLETTPFP